MSTLLRRRPWDLPDHALTDERDWLDRRRFLAHMAYAGAGLALTTGCAEASEPPIAASPGWDVSAAPRNERYTLDRPLTDEVAAARHNNFYEFTTQKDQVWRMAGSLQVKPWTIQVRGQVEQEFDLDFEDFLTRFPREERTYRFRCVEAWSMAVPWIGVPLATVLAACKPKSSARYVKLVSRADPDQMPGVASQPWYRWPYYEGLTLAEATHELALLAVGIYGHALPNQHGAPVRLVVPWKYGFKNIKSIVRIELTDRQPPTFWNDLASTEYDFAGNVRPDVPHPRWSQATEQKIPTGERVPTLMYNGYADLVASLYRG